MSNIIEKSKKESVELLRKELDNDLSLSSIIKYLSDKSQFSLNGRAGTHTQVNKEALRLASVYLKDYSDILEGDI